MRYKCPKCGVVFHSDKPINSKYGYKYCSKSCQSKSKGFNIPKRIKSILHDMINRCENPKNKRYDNYGKRNIQVVEEWKNKYGSLNFYIWALKNNYQENLTIDRIDVNGNYEPNNCRWVDLKTQQNNRTNNRLIEFNNKIYTLKTLCEEYNVSYKAVWYRLKQGWSLEDALFLPFKKRG